MKIANDVFGLAAERPEQEHLILLSALSVLWLSPQNPEAQLILERYRDRCYSFESLREAALQLFLIAGFQTSIEAAFQIREVYGEGLPGLDKELEVMDAKQWLERGFELQSQVYGESVVRLRSNLGELSPELAVWPVLVGYGLVLSRPGLPPHWRELLEVAVLAVQNFPRQLFSHLRGALNLGASPEEVETVLRVADIMASPEASRSAWQLWRRINP
ncbi:carboxymuconolactone decarboxylase family protein [bacterium]|nr:carboxymuconolactone decarboxylase family protein [bacterium]MBU1984046.1 carboxymuconolactone decarboxylase family protein [bacterium]